MKYWFRKHSWLIGLVFTFLMLTLQALAYFGVQPKQLGFLLKRSVFISVFEISIIVLLAVLTAYRLACRSIMKRSTLPLTTEEIDKLKRRADAKRNHPKELENLINQWQGVVNSDASPAIKRRGDDGGYFIEHNSDFKLLFEKTKSYTDAEVAAIAIDFPKLQNYVKKIKDIKIDTWENFVYLDDLTAHIKGQLRRIIALLENMRKSITG